LGSQEKEAPGTGSSTQRECLWGDFCGGEKGGGGHRGLKRQTMEAHRLRGHQPSQAKPAV